jgi:hypothetical protein
MSKSSWLTTGPIGDSDSNGTYKYERIRDTGPFKAA